MSGLLDLTSMCFTQMTGLKKPGLSVFGEFRFRETCPDTWGSGLADLQSQCLYTGTGLENPYLKQIWILPSRSGLCPLKS